jgi:chemotaxis protein methyltransferase CheR
MEQKIDTSQFNISGYFNAQLGSKDFNRLSEFIHQQYGIKMPLAKKIMLQSRLQKRLRALNITNFKEYVDYVFSDKGQNEEVIHMMDVVSTNKTDFFREPVHFDFLLSDVLPEFYANTKSRHLKVWSAGCSSGEEPYTISIVLNEFTEKHPGFDYTIFASDISTIMLKSAINAIYKEEKIVNIPMSIKKKYFLRSKNKEEKKVRIISSLRRKIVFKRFNLISDSYNTPDIFDIIFCRNVLIYFNKETQQDILYKLCTRLKNNGILFLGHSESITGLELPLKILQPTIFKRL